MRDVKVVRYMKKLEYSYAYGTYPTIDLLKYKPERVNKVLLKNDGFGSEGVEEIISLCKEKNIKYEVNDRAIDKVSAKENTYALGIFEKYEEELDLSENHVVLVNPSNVGNLGTIIRTMRGFNFSDLAIIKPGVDIFDPLLVRSTMGAFFQTRFKYFESIDEYLTFVGDREKYALMLDGAESIEDIEPNKPYSLIFGNEGAGLDSRYSELATPVYIPQSKNIDSLNLSIAVGISLYVLKDF